MKSLHICHLTVLNPCQHSRIFYRLACSQVALGYRVSILGIDPAQAPYFAQGVQIIPFPPIRRLSLKRPARPFALLSRTLREKPDIVTIHSPELLFVALVLRLFGKKILYDVHEDYYATLSQAYYYPAWLRYFLAIGVRVGERCCVPFFQGVSYAESCYDNLLRAPARKKVVLQNKFAPPPSLQEFSPPFSQYLLYTGTLAPSWGTDATLQCWRRLNEVKPLPLVMAGHTHDPALVKDLRMRVRSWSMEDRFALIGGTTYVPYDRIVALMQHCLAGTALYQSLGFLQNKIPTRFFEYMAAQKPLLFSPFPYWEQLNREWQLGIPLFRPWDPHEVWETLENWSATHPPERYLWASEVPRLEELLHNVRGKALPLQP